MRGIDVEDETVLVVRKGLELEDLGLDVGLEVHHETDRVGLELPDAHGGDVGIVGLDGGNLFLQRDGELEPLDVDDEAQRLRRADEEVLEVERGVVLERDSGVLLGGPHANVDHAGASGDLPRRKAEKERARRAEHEAASVDHSPASETWATSASPSGVSPFRTARRPRPSRASSMTRSASGT